MVDEFDAPSRSGRVWPCPLHSHKPCDPRCLSRWDLHRRGEASMSCRHCSASRLHAVGKSRRSRLSFRWYHLKQTTAGKARSCSKAGPHRNFCWIQRHLRSPPLGNLLAFRNKPICWRASVSSLWCFETILSILRCTPLMAIVALSWGCWHIFT